MWKGAEDLLGITSESGHTYRGEEEKVFEVKEKHQEIKLLIEQLETRKEENKNETQEEQA